MKYNSIIDNYLEGSEDIARALENLNVEVETGNLILSDLDHFLELEDLTDDQIHNLTVRRKVILTERRRCKDIISVIDRILPKQIEGRTTRDRYEHAIRSLDTRVYSPRKIKLEEAIKDL